MVGWCWLLDVGRLLWAYRASTRSGLTSSTRPAAGQCEGQIYFRAKGARAPRRTPSSPSSVNPQRTGLPTSTARAPRARALSTSVPRRTPPSEPAPRRCLRRHPRSSEEPRLAPAPRPAVGRRGWRRVPPPAPCFTASFASVPRATRLSPQRAAARSRAQPLDVLPRELPRPTATRCNLARRRRAAAIARLLTVQVPECVSEKFAERQMRGHAQLVASVAFPERARPGECQR